jgi:hypothetical protein
MTKKSFVRKLPGYIQTPTNKKFFKATVDQLYTKRDSDHLNGYIGRRVGNRHDPINDFYLPEPTKERTWRQLEPTVYTVDQDNLDKTNITFYDDFINFISQYGGITGNHDRLFSTNSYSFAPPIDYDKFINYQNYYWIPDKLPVIDISGMDDTSVETLVIGQENFNTNSASATPTDLEFTSGIRVRFVDSTSYNEALTVERVGSSIVLIEDKPDTISDIEYTLLAWDGVTVDGTVTWDNQLWDVLPWDAVKKPLGDDYITIERGAIDCNAWSRSNKWYHVDAVNTAVTFTTGTFPQNAIQALRPVIEFYKDIELYNSGINFLQTVDHVVNTSYSTVHGQTVNDVLNILEFEVLDGQTLIFPDDNFNNQEIFEASISGGIISLSPLSITITEGDIVFATGGLNEGVTYYFTTEWTLSYNQKTKENQSPLFNLYDSDGTSLSEEAKYPNNDFRGSEIFSYKINEDPSASNDVVLGFPVQYKSLGTASDIVFENDLEIITYNYIQDNNVIEIGGYYYFRIVNESDDINDSSDWTFRSEWVSSGEPTKQRVVDRYVVGFDATDLFRLSVTPVDFDEGVDTGDVIVIANGSVVEISASDFTVINDDIYYQNTTFSEETVVELKTYTKDLLEDDSRGYFEIPSQLESNSNNTEITEYSIGELTEHFVSIIDSQNNIEGVAFGGPTNYRDTPKDGSLGDVIIQSESSLLRSMLLSSSDDLNLLESIRYSQNEYNKFKSKFIKTAQQLINRNFIPTVGSMDIIIDEWFEEIIKTVTISKEFSNSFAYSYMVARGDIFKNETFGVLPGLINTLTIHADLSDPKNVLYLYVKTGETEIENENYEQVFNKTTDIERLLIEGIDYIIQDSIDPNDPIVIKFLTVPSGQEVYARIYEDAKPAYIPSTPSKLGCYKTYIPEMKYDTSFVEPTWVIIGHDGSRTPTYGEYDSLGNVITPDFRDNLILELERRIYNGIDAKFKEEYDILLRLEDVKPGRFRTTDYSLKEYNTITKPYFTKWATKNKLDFTTNDFYDAGDWRTWNYRYIGDPLNSNSPWPGHWKGIYEYYYDTYQPHLAPWEMLGFSIKPTWWDTTYTTDYSSNNTAMWTDIENGLIADGTGVPSQGYVDERYVRVGMLIPVDASGNLIDLPTLFSIPATPPIGADSGWIYGDGAPVERSWMNSSEYQYSIVEFLYLMKPAKIGEVLWNPSKLEYGIGNQLIDIDQNSRRKNENIYVHAETIDENVVVNTGIEVFVSDRLLFLGKNITEGFGEKVRNVGVNLGYRLAGYTNAETLRMFLDGSSPESSSNSLQIPNNNYQVSIHTSPSVGIYNYSGVIIRIDDAGKFIVYGYDLLNLSFKIFERSTTSKQIQVTEAGKPHEFTYFDTSTEYNIGDIVKYNSVFYEAISNVDAGAFSISDWKKLPKLPVSGGVTVSYKPQSSGNIVEIPYGTKFDSIQETFDFLIGYGDYLESEGWVFDEVNESTNQVKNWLNSAKEFLFWISSDWESDSSLFLSPLADGPKLIVDRGYPSSVEKLSNGVYSILDKNGVAILPEDTQIERDDQEIQINPKNFSDGIYFTRVTSKETEHIILFDNITDFNDVIYDPVLGIRQNRLRFNGRKSNGWFGKFEADGYLIVGDRLIQNYDNITESLRYYYDSDVQLDNVNVEDAARHLIGYEAKDYLTNLELVDDAQYEFYKGFVRDKGTQSGLTRILRSDFIQNADTTKVFEEWAFKVADFGGQCENTQIDFVIDPSHVQSNPQVIRLNYNRSDEGFISEIKTFNSQDVYTEVPTLVIDAPTGSNQVQATAVVVLDDNNKIGSIVMGEKGSGYETTPSVTIVRNDSLPVNDVVHAVYSPEITKDTVRDEIIDIDIDDSEQWVILPQNCSFETMPTTSVIDYQLPNAGYVNKNDVDYMAFNDESVYSLWNSNNSSMSEKTIWKATGSDERWAVYLLTDVGAITNANVGVVNDEDVAIVNVDTSKYSDQYGRYFDSNFNFLNDRIITSAVNIEVYKNIYETSSMTTLVERVLLNTILCYVKYNSDLGEHVVYNLNDEEILFNTEFGFETDSNESIDIVYNNMVNLRFSDMSEFLNFDTVDNETSTPSGQKIWMDSDSGLWKVKERTAPSTFVDHRIQEDLIDTNLYDNAYLYDKDSKETIVRLPVYDPFKGLIPGRAEQNISYKTFNDPARYTNSASEHLVDPNRTFGIKEVGKLWWDLNTVRYMYYEQPSAEGEDETTNLIYRRNNWGKTFPGSSIDIYEWTRSTVPPANYTGDGTPKNTTDYVKTTEFNYNLNQYISVYYFWVKNGSKIPNLANRTLTAKSVASLLANPRASGYEWFSPVKKNDNSDSYIFGNVDRTISNGETIAQVNYKNSDDANEIHTQWKLLREGDEESLIPDYLWNKMVDSLVGTTDLVPLSEYSDAVPVTATEGVLYVPDPTLSDALKYGSSFRPRQSMFTDITESRRVFVQVANNILSQIPIRDFNEDWNIGLNSNNLWTYVDWYEEGYDSTNTIANRQVETEADLTTLGDAIDGEIIRVLSFTPSPSDRARYYVYVEESNYFGLVRIQEASIEFSNEIYEGSNDLETRTEIRELLETLKTVVLIDDRIVGINELFFALVNYVFSEQSQIDWVFKTSYIYITQDQQSFDQSTTTYRIDPFDNVKEYMLEAKPYRTKIRDIVSEFGNIPDEALVIAQDDAIGVFDEETNTWSSVTENLRFMDIEIDINRTECLVPEWCEFQGTVINAYKFNLDGWDSSPWDAFGWDSVDIEHDTIVNGSEFIETDYTYVYQGKRFESAGDYPEDLVPVAPMENIVLTVRTEDPLSSTEIEYKQHITPLGYTDYIRMSGVENATLTELIDSDSTDIEVDDASSLYVPDKNIDYDYGVIWIGDERIEYGGIEGNTLTNIRRGSLGTSIVDHEVGDTIFDGTDRQKIPNANNEWWVNNSDGLANSTTEQAEFLKEKPII